MNTTYSQCERCHKVLDPTIPVESGILCQWCYIMEEELEDSENGVEVDYNF